MLLKNKIKRLSDKGLSKKEIAKRCGCSIATVFYHTKTPKENLVKKVEERGRIGFDREQAAIKNFPIVLADSINANLEAAQLKKENDLLKKKEALYLARIDLLNFTLSQVSPQGSLEL